MVRPSENPRTVYPTNPGTLFSLGTKAHESDRRPHAGSGGYTIVMEMAPSAVHYPHGSQTHPARRVVGWIRHGTEPRLRTPHIHLLRRQTRRAQGPLPRSHHRDLQASRHGERRLLGSP